MKRLTILFTVMLSGAAAVWAQPSITAGGVTNGASFAPAGLPNGSIAQGSIFTIKGTNLGPSPGMSNGATTLPTSLGGVSATATVGGTTSKLFLTYVSATQINAVLPSATPTGTGTVTVTFNGTVSSPITVVASSFGTFTINSAGTGPAIITRTDYTLNTLTSAANPGEAFIIWGTGLGPVTGDESVGTPGAKPANINVQVYVGGQSATVLGYARSGFTGEDQIAAMVPNGVTGCYVPVVVVVGTTPSNFTTMSSAATGRTCTDTSGLNLGMLAQQGTVSTGSVSLNRSTTSITLPPPIGTQNSTTDSGSGVFDRFTYSQYIGEFNPLNISTVGACTVYTFAGSTTTFADPVQPVYLDAGPALTVTGPNGTKQLMKNTTAGFSFYSATLGGGFAIPGGPAAAPLFLDAGNYTVSGPGGADVGPFTVNLTLAAPLVWTNIASISTINRASGVNVTWSGGDPKGQVEIVGTSSSGGTPAVGAAFICLAPVSAGQFQVPAPVTLALPPSPSGAAAAGGILSVGDYSMPASFTAKGLDYGFVTASGSSSKTVTWQ